MTGYHFFLVAAAVIALSAAVVDARTGHIPNALTLGALAVAPCAHAVVAALHSHSASAAARSAGFSVVGAILCAILPLAMYRSAGLGGGDVKLFAAIGALANGFVGLHAETYAFVFGMVWALVVVARSGRLAATLRNVASLVGAPLSRPAGEKNGPAPSMTSMPFGPAILVGTLLADAMLWSGR